MERKIRKSLIKYQKHIPCNYCYKLVCVDDKFSKLFRKYLGKDAADNFTNNMIEESKYCCEAIKNVLTKNFWWLKKTMKILRTLLNVRSVTMIMLIMMSKWVIIVISLETIESLHIEIVTSILN